MISNGGVGHGPPCDTSSVENKGDVVDVAVAPVLARFGGANDGMAGTAGVRGCVFVGGVVAAADVTAGLAHPQVDPPITACEAFLAAGNVVGQLGELDAVEMRAASGPRGFSGGPAS